MECNKEEAIRAKGIAERKMQNKDFNSARKIAQKAQLLYTDLENISQMIMVCDVHCSAVKKLAGNEMDWYDILQIEQTADEATIKKQYRKFALLLHPDKNKFPGAEAAFKLIGEAQRLLLDKGKRSLFDVKRKAYVSKPAPPYRSQQSAFYSQNVGVQNNYRNNSTGFSSQQQQQAGQQEFSNGRATFWTACPFCHVKYQYYIQVVNKSLICQSCNKPFVAYERAGTATPTRAATATNLNQSTFHQRKDVPSQGFRQGNSNAEHSQTEFFQKKVDSSELNSQKVNGKRQRKKEAESSESCDTESSIGTRDATEVDEDGDFTAGVNVGCHGERPRRSDRRKQHVSYKESQSDDEDFPGHPKKVKGSGSSCATEEENGNGLKEDLFETNKHSGLASGVKDHNGVKKKESSESLPNEEKATKNVKGKEKAEVNGYKETSEARIDSVSNLSSKSAFDPELYEYPDPEFYDFDKGRAEGCFSVGQIWAVYDTFDAMPRFYVRIRKIFFPEFKLRITWLEPDPDNEDEIGWVNEGLPVSCGKFKHGFSEYTEDRLMFSHMVIWENGSQRDPFKIFPRKGEIWAIFKDWDVKWKSDAFSNQEYEYEFVEILSEYTEGVGVYVAYLGKLKGFVSVFCHKGGNASFQIPSGELFRFAHMIPSFKLTGQERKGVPKGSFELDPASLPKNIEDISVPEGLVLEVGNNHLNGSFSGTSDKVKSEIESEASTSGHQADVNADLESEVDSVHVDHSAPPASTSDAIEIPEPLFFNFDAGKSIDKFEVGQIWSLYSDEDGLPKYYGRITNIASDQGFELQLMWLAARAMPNDVICWHDKDMPICCGRFKTRKGKSQTYTSNISFSHRLNAEPTDKKNEFIILPRKGQVWALYRNWSAEIKCCDLVNCEYDVVEVLEENGLRIKVSFLEQVDGFNSVFKAQFKQGSAVTMEVLYVDILRFSHQIPAFKLTDERNGSLRGFWELDPAALPVHYFTRCRLRVVPLSLDANSILAGNLRLLEEVCCGCYFFGLYLAGIQR